jgi:hypothetical protein
MNINPTKNQPPPFASLRHISSLHTALKGHAIQRKKFIEIGSKHWFFSNTTIFNGIHSLLVLE